MNFDPATIVIIALAFIVAGGVKGIVGMGLPPISLGILVLSVDLKTAIALTLVPAFVANIWQACVGGNGRALFLRLWPMLLVAAICIFAGTALLTRVDVGALTGLLGVILILYAALNLFGLRFHIAPKFETAAGPAVGLINGLLTGLTGVASMPGVIYLQAIGLEKEELVQALGLLFIVSTVALIIAMQGQGLLGFSLGLASVYATVPTVIGLVIGQRIRKVMSDAAFRRFFLIAILSLGLFIFIRTLLV